MRCIFNTLTTFNNILNPIDHKKSFLIFHIRIEKKQTSARTLGLIIMKQVR